MVPNWKFITSKVQYFIAFGFGSGLSPFAPGTSGTLVGIPIYILLVKVFPMNVVLGVIALFYLLGIWICDLAGKAVLEADHPGIVWDEIVAILMVMFFVPQNLYGYIEAFLVFRFFDILKPWPINLVDRHMKNGHGVMLDDLLAAIYSIFTIQAVLYLIRI
jgi:phosphatidylglycerophosphatase A